MGAKVSFFMLRETEMALNEFLLEYGNGKRDDRWKTINRAIREYVLYHSNDEQRGRGTTA